MSHHRSLALGRPARLVVLLGWLGVGLLSPGAAAQQFVVDDAGITDPGACQVEGWVSAEAAWLLPACTPLGRTELTIGVGYAAEEVDGVVVREVEYVAQAKVQVLADEPGRAGLAVVAGAGLGPFAQAAGLPIDGFFGYVPLTYTLGSEHAQVHFNGGLVHYREGGVSRALYGARADARVHEHVAIIGEIFGEGEDVGLQVGMRITAIPDRLQFDASFGQALHGHTPSIGFALGIAWTPSPFFAPLR